MKEKNKKSEEKIRYYDDNSTISNMSNVRGPIYSNKKSSSTSKEKMDTFFKAFKMMLLPTGVALLIILILYIIFTLIGSFAS